MLSYLAQLNPESGVGPTPTTNPALAQRVPTIEQQVLRQRCTSQQRAWDEVGWASILCTAFWNGNSLPMGGVGLVRSQTAFHEGNMRVLAAGVGTRVLPRWHVLACSVSFFDRYRVADTPH